MNRFAAIWRAPARLALQTAFAFVCAAHTARAARPYDCPALQERHSTLRSLLVRSLAAKDWLRVEQACRAGVRLDATDPFWRYNLACALSRLGKTDAALEELAVAVRLGFRDTAALEGDSDIAPLRASPRFAELIAIARDKTKPLPDTFPAAKKTASAKAGGILNLCEENMTWDFDNGMFRAAAEIAPAGDPKTCAAAYAGPAAAKIRKWLAEGSAAGNAGDAYMNRDHGHSVLQRGKFPLLTAVSMDAEARKRNFDTDTPEVTFGFPVFANCSRAYNKGSNWRSEGRFLMGDRKLASRMARLYLSNQIHVFPANNDFTAKLDAFHCASPYIFATRGASWSDTPLLELLLAASAAFRPETKAEILRRGLLAPTLQSLLRQSVSGSPGVFSQKANPVVFSTNAIDAGKLAELAHAMTPDAIPPVALLGFFELRDGPAPAPGRDYPDVMRESYIVTPCASCFVMRAIDGVRRFSLTARPAGVPDGIETSFHWCVVSGDASAVRITEEPGSGGRRAVAEIDRRRIEKRLDIACFARTATSGWGAPSFISFMPVPGETRTYRPDGQILSIDYRNTQKKYCDAKIALPKAWRDVYMYDGQGRCQAIARFRGDDGNPVLLTPDGKIAHDMDADMKPASVSTVHYIVRETGDPSRPEEIVWAEDAPVAVPPSPASSSPGVHAENQPETHAP